MAEIGRENLENIEENERMALGHFRLTTFLRLTTFQWISDGIPYGEAWRHLTRLG